MSDEEIFVVSHTENEIQVFDSETLMRKSSILVPNLVKAWDITLSKNILFVGETAGMIHRVPLNSLETFTWSVDSPLTLSTLNSGNILVTCFLSNKLIEYTTTGQLVREIPLQPGITNPRHAIQINNDRFLVCHCGELDRVCLIDNKGRLIKSYGGAQGSGPGAVDLSISLSC